jgi:hypothetical protein
MRKGAIDDRLQHLGGIQRTDFFEDFLSLIQHIIQ